MKQYNLNEMANMVFNNHTCEEYIEVYSHFHFYASLSTLNGKAVEMAIEIAKNLPTKKLSFEILKPWIHGLISYSIWGKEDERLTVIKDIIMKKLTDSLFASNEICEIMKHLWDTCEAKFEEYE